MFHSKTLVKRKWFMWSLVTNPNIEEFVFHGKGPKIQLCKLTCLKSSTKRKSSNTFEGDI